jgi:hypothetical protein
MQNDRVSGLLQRCGPYALVTGASEGKGPFTVFAPTDVAFAKIPKADLDALLKDKAKLTAALTHHVVAGKVMAADMKAGKVKTVQGSEITISTMGGPHASRKQGVRKNVTTLTAPTGDETQPSHDHPGGWPARYSAFYSIKHPDRGQGCHKYRRNYSMV